MNDYQKLNAQLVELRKAYHLFCAKNKVDANLKAEIEALFRELFDFDSQAEKLYK
jgi:hypothetical protein